MSRKQREETVAVLSSRMRDIGGMIVFDYTSVNVEKVTALRRQIREVGSEMRVAKNTLLRIASSGTAYEKLHEHFCGQTAVAFIDSDPAKCAKVLTKFIKDNPTLKCEVRAGVLGSDLLGEADITALGNLPSREVLLGQLVGTMAAPITGFVSVLAEVPRTFLRALSAIAEQKQG